MAPRGESGMRAEGRSRPAISDVTSEMEGFINIKETSSRRYWCSPMWDGTVVRCARVRNIQEMRDGGEALTITVDGVTAEHETQASVEENTAVPVSAANTYGHSVIAVLAAVAGVLILA